MFGASVIASDVGNFIYSGGSNPGSKRTVLVLEEDGKNCKCWDFGKRALRTFTKSKMSKWDWNVEAKFVNLENIPASAHNAIHIALEKEGFSCTAYNQEIIAVKIKEEPKKYPLVYAKFPNTIVVEEMYGKFCIVPQNDGSVALIYNDKVIRNATTKDLQDMISDITIPF